MELPPETGTTFADNALIKARAAALATGVRTDTQRPFAVVIVGGLISRLRNMPVGDLAFDDTFFELMRHVMHHVADEETVLLPAAERLLPDIGPSA